jgi:hypothetical protein
MGVLRVLVYLLVTALPSWALADCSCIYAGGNAKLGETACINTAKGNSLARCEMALNNSSWTVLDQPCDVKQSLLQDIAPVAQGGS